MDPSRGNVQPAQPSVNRGSYRTIILDGPIADARGRLDPVNMATLIRSFVALPAGGVPLVRMPGQILDSHGQGDAQQQRGR